MLKAAIFRIYFSHINKQMVKFFGGEGGERKKKKKKKRIFGMHPGEIG